MSTATRSPGWDGPERRLAPLSASAIGGVIGAVAFLLAIPVARPLVTSFGPPEFFMLAVFGVTMVASLSREGLLPGLVVAVIGALLAMVGFDDLSAAPRFTFGSLELWDGLNIVALICGVYVVPEMLTLTGPSEEEARQRAIGTTVGDVYKGVFVTFRHKVVVLRSTFLGLLVGVTPAVGASVAVWLAYGDTARRTKSDIPFGEGAIAGVIAPEAANNSKEGGAMIPTLFFGIPGSSTMAIMIAALSYVGVVVGPNLLTKDIGLSYALAATIFLANLPGHSRILRSHPVGRALLGGPAPCGCSDRDFPGGDVGADQPAVARHHLPAARGIGPRDGPQAGELAARPVHPRLHHERAGRNLVSSDAHGLGLGGLSASDQSASSGIHPRVARLVLPAPVRSPARTHREATLGMAACPAPGLHGDGFRQPPFARRVEPSPGRPVDGGCRS